ncbi:pseudouridine synthase [uncultured Intestinimonas sp.]|uniref:pseudouridine synthase n=1 Tax=uncultured Intestinimonas sp. TaxID=1689265 RepID=UPI0025FC94B5|nr:pseudouridine synthase [uncultured Intestinimonas sp.]
MEERLQKLLSAAGVCSRRRAEDYIEAGRVTVNGRVAGLGDKADLSRDTVALDGVELGPVPEPVYLMLNKPRGFVSTLSDEQGRRTAAGLVAGCGVRVWPVGRLDLDSEGLLLFTNDGALTHKLLHPSHEVDKQYLVLVTGDIDAALPLLSGPMELDEVALAPAQVDRLGPNLLSVIIHEGRNRQVRRMCAQAGLTVKALRRVREGNIQLGGLKLGTWRFLTEEEVEQLRRI